MDVADATPGARQATPADAAELTRLRGVMFLDLGQDIGAGVNGSESWQQACRTEFRRRLAGDDLAAFVVDAPDGAGLASGAVGFVDHRLPGPEQGMLHGHVASVATDPRWRRQGMARWSLLALLHWFEVRGVTRVGLNASAEGEGLYRSLGFGAPRHPVLHRRFGGPLQHGRC